MNAFDLVAKLTLDSSEYDRALRKAKGSTTGFSQSAIKSIASARKVVTGAALGMGTALVAFAGSSLKTGLEFDSSMSQVAATMGMTMDDLSDSSSQASKDFQRLRDFAQEMGAKTAFSATQAADALNYMALAGYDADTSMKMLPTVLNLAAAGGIDLASASDMVTDAQTALGLSIDETTDMVDKMAKASSKSNTSVAQLGEAFLTVGGTAKDLKGGTTELSQVLGILADNGIKGSEGGTALRNVILALEAPTDQARKAMEELGLQVFDSEGNMRSMKDIFSDLNGVLGNMTQGEKTDVLNTIFNKVDLKSVNALLGTNVDRWDELSAAIDDSKGSAEAMADVQLNNLSGDITLLKSAFEGLQIKVSDELAPAFRVAIKFLTKLIDHADTLGPIILGVATALGVFAVAINIGTIIAKTTKALNGFLHLLSANPIGLIVAAIAGLVVAFVTLYKHNEKFREFVDALWERIKTVIAEAIPKVQEIFDKVKEVFENIKNAVTTAWDTIVNVVKFAFSVIQAIIETAVTILLVPWQFIWENFGTTITEAWDNIKNIISTAVNIISSIITTVFNAIYSVISSILNAIMGVVSSVMSTISSIISSIWNAIYSIISSILSRIFGVVSSIWNSISSSVSGAMNGIRNTISNGMNAAKDVISNVLSAIGSKFTSIFNTAKDTVSNAVSTIKGMFNFSWSLPHISLPHFSVSGGVAPWGFGGKGSLPSVSVSWYKKAMNDAYLLDGATFFGSANGKLLGGGEAGREIIIGEQKALDMISSASGAEEMLARINYLIKLLEYYLPKRSFPNNKQIDRMLGELI